MKSRSTSVVLRSSVPAARGVCEVGGSDDGMQVVMSLPRSNTVCPVILLKGKIDGATPQLNPLDKPSLSPRGSPSSGQ